MNWIRENKFLTGFIAILVIGAGVLGYLLYTAWGTYAEVTDQYTQAANDLHQLQIRVPYPDRENLAKYGAEREDLVAATGTLAASLSQMVLPVEELTPSAFQDRLRDTVSAVVAKAGQTGVKLPDKFALSFDKYETQPPAAAAAGPLGRQLAALQIAVNILLDEHVDSILSFQRTTLPQEGGGEGGGGRSGRGGGAGGGFGPRGGSGNGGGGGSREVDKAPVDIRFTANQLAFQKVLNDFAASNKQFFITRTLVVENTDPKPITKGTESLPGAPAGAAPGAAQPGAPGTSGTGGDHLKFIVGTEKLNVAMRVDMVTFNVPESAHKGAEPSH